MNTLFYLYFIFSILFLAVSLWFSFGLYRKVNTWTKKGGYVKKFITWKLSTYNVLIFVVIIIWLFFRFGFQDFTNVMFRGEQITAGWIIIRVSGFILICTAMILFVLKEFQAYFFYNDYMEIITLDGVRFISWASIERVYCDNIPCAIASRFHEDKKHLVFLMNKGMDRFHIVVSNFDREKELIRTIQELSGKEVEGRRKD